MTAPFETDVISTSTGDVAITFIGHGSLIVNAVSAYNIVNKRPDGSPFHPKGAGNGYIVTFGDTIETIAFDWKVSPQEITNAYRLSPDLQLVVGQTIILPALAGL